MADQDKELKELEKSLEQELDQEVDLTGPSDSRLDGNLDLNPSIPDPTNASEKDSVNEEAQEEKQEEEISLGQMFASKVEGEKEKSTDSLEVQEEIIEISWIDSKLEKWGLPLAKELPSFLKEKFNHFVKEDLKKHLQKAVETAKHYQAKLKKYIQVYKKMPRQEKLLVLSIALLTLSIPTGIYYLSENDLLPGFDTGYVDNFDKVADQVYYIDESEEWDDFLSPLRSPEFVVELEKIKANVRPTYKSTSTPMVYFKVRLKASSRKTAIEIKDREFEVRDIISRTTEEMSYDELLTERGKRIFKNKIKQNLAEMLNYGFIRDVYFKDLIIKP